MRIRPVRDEDRARLFEIWRDAVHATHDFLSQEDLAEITAMVERAYIPVTDFTVAVDDDDRPLGFIEIEHGSQIGALFVDLAAHGRGIGRALAEAALPAGEAHTVEVNEQNAQARAVYERWGFRVARRFEKDHQGRPYPLLLMRRDAVPS